MSSMLDILVVAYHARKELIQTIASISLFTKPGYRLTVYENAAHNYPLTWLWNKFVESSRRPYVALCNPDILVGPGWDTETLACLEEHPQVGVVQPFTNCGQHNDLFQTAGGQFPGDMEIEAAPDVTNRLKQEFSHRRFAFGTNRDLVFGHCYILSRNVWKELGGFDEKFQFGGNEYDFNERLVKRNKHLAVCGHAFAYHFWNASSKEAKSRDEWDYQKGQPIFKTPPSYKSFSEV